MPDGSPPEELRLHTSEEEEEEEEDVEFEPWQADVTVIELSNASDHLSQLAHEQIEAHSADPHEEKAAIEATNAIVLQHLASLQQCAQDLRNLVPTPHQQATFETLQRGRSLLLTTRPLMNDFVEQYKVVNAENLPSLFVLLWNVEKVSRGLDEVMHNSDALMDAFEQSPVQT